MGFFTFRRVRILIWLGALLVAGSVTAYQHHQTRSWVTPLEVVIHPIAGSSDKRVQRYIGTLSSADFTDIETWATREAARYKLSLEHPIKVTLGEPVTQLPPTPPENSTGWDVAWWSLRFRWWAFRNTPDDDKGLARVRVYTIYHELNERNPAPLAHSLGLQRGLLGMVNAYASARQTAQNNIVIAHEVLHTVGAVDKYDAYGHPVWPHGYASPQRQPLYPQRAAEIMAGRIPTSHSASYMAMSLRSVVLNPDTAREINWVP